MAGPNRPRPPISVARTGTSRCEIRGLVDTGAGLVLIDTGPQEAVPHVLASIRALGFDQSGSAGSFHTHEHFNVGGLAAIPAETGADVVTGPFIGDALRSGRPLSR